jgi:hypothetical protein
MVQDAFLDQSHHYRKVYLWRVTKVWPLPPAI